MSVSLMLTSLVQKGDNDINPVRLAVGGGNDPFQILIVVVGRFIVGITVYFIRDTVVADISQDKKILAPYGFGKKRLAFAGAEPVTGTVQNIVVRKIAFKGRIVFGNVFYAFSKAHKMIVDVFS